MPKLIKINSKQEFILNSSAHATLYSYDYEGVVKIYDIDENGVMKPSPFEINKIENERLIKWLSEICECSLNIGAIILVDEDGTRITLSQGRSFKIVKTKVGVGVNKISIE